MHTINPKFPFKIHFTMVRVLPNWHLNGKLVRMKKMSKVTKTRGKVTKLCYLHNSPQNSTQNPFHDGESFAKMAYTNGILAGNGQNCQKRRKRNEKVWNCVIYTIQPKIPLKIHL